MQEAEVINFVIDLEGGYVDNPRDPGGETNFGISKKSYPDVDIKNLTREQAYEIYKRDYYDKMQIGLFRQDLRLPIFDCGVNQGKSTAIKILQHSLELLVDGKITPLLISKAYRSKSLELKYMVARADRYRMSKNVDIFYRGWIKRLFKVYLRNNQA